MGASQAVSDVQPPGHIAAALTALRRLVTPGGRVLFGDGFWQRPPTEAELAAMWPGTTAGELPDLAQIADLAVAAGFRPAWIETATQEEWEEFESAYQADEEEWLAAHPDHPRAAEIRQRARRAPLVLAARLPRPAGPGLPDPGPGRLTRRLGRAKRQGRVSPTLAGHRRTG